jgi:hypothetical protein
MPVAKSVSLETLLGDWKKLLSNWVNSGALTSAASEALQLKAEPGPLKTLVSQWSHGDFSGLPPIVLLPGSSMPGAAGAYAISTGTIYLNQDWLATASPVQAVAVLTEELGHHLDGLLNAVDTPGDEGELFAALLRGEGAISDQQRKRLEAMISERGLDREVFKKMAYDDFAVEHFADLTDRQYESICHEVENSVAPPKPAAASSPAVEQEAAAGGGFT